MITYCGNLDCTKFSNDIVRSRLSDVVVFWIAWWRYKFVQRETAQISRYRRRITRYGRTHQVLFCDAGSFSRRSEVPQIRFSRTAKTRCLKLFQRLVDASGEDIKALMFTSTFSISPASMETLWTMEVLSGFSELGPLFERGKWLSCGSARRNTVSDFERVLSFCRSIRSKVGNQYPRCI